MYKNFFLSIFILAFVSSGIAQSDWTKFANIKDLKADNPTTLANEITAAFDNELDQIKAIYYWVAHNIRYDYGIIAERAKERAKNIRYSKEEIRSRRNEAIIRTLKRKRGVCQDYAYLFKSICEAAGIECAFIGGWVKSNNNKTKDKGNNHAWNAVKYKGEWKLLDVTFGSGYLDAKKKFVFKFEPNYLFVDEDIFSLNHFPADDQWLLNAQVTDRETFSSYLNVGRAFLEHEISELNHLNKRLEIEDGADLELEFKVKKPMDQIVCFKPSTGKRVDLEIEKNGMSYRIKIDHSKLRNGLYVFTNGEQMLFSYVIAKQ